MQNYDHGSDPTHYHQGAAFVDDKKVSVEVNIGEGWIKFYVDDEFQVEKKVKNAEGTMDFPDVDIFFGCSLCNKGESFDVL